MVNIHHFVKILFNFVKKLLTFVKKSFTLNISRQASQTT